EALYALLVRDDVPIRVRIDGDKLEVHATEGQHRIFGAFLKMLNSGEAQHSGTWTPAPTPRGATGRRTLTETKSASSPRGMRQLEELKALGKTQDAAVAELKNSAAWREMLKAQGDDAKLQLKSLKDSLRNAARTSQAEGSAMQAEAERLAEAAQEQAEKAASMLDNAASMKNMDAARAKALEQAAKEFEKKARELEKKVQQLENRARTKDRETSRAEEQAEELEELLGSPDIAAETVDVMEGVEIPVIDAPGIETTAPEVEVDLPEIEVVVPPVEIPEVPPAEPSKAAPPAAPPTPAPPATPAPTAPTPR
ncbi:MAG: hypothetical protein HZB38_14930, partial [Planctomycetes bacterium]|nr:hypothetical protein [Planctomycetota bacterium]